MSEDNKILPKEMYMAYHSELGWFHSSLTTNEESSRAETYLYTGIDQTKVSVKKVLIKEIQ